MKNSFKFFRFPFIRSCLVLIFITGVACSRNPVHSTGKENPSDLGEDPILRKVEFTGDLAGKIKIAGVRQAIVNQNLLKIQVGLQNLTDKELDLIYKLEWLDDDGMTVKDTSMVWKPVLLRGGETVEVQSVATTPNAKNFNLKIQKAKNS